MGDTPACTKWSPRGSPLKAGYGVGGKEESRMPRDIGRMGPYEFGWAASLAASSPQSCKPRPHFLCLPHPSEPIGLSFYWATACLPNTTVWASELAIQVCKCLILNSRERGHVCLRKIGKERKRLCVFKASEPVPFQLILTVVL